MSLPFFTCLPFHHLSIYFSFQNSISTNEVLDNPRKLHSFNISSEIDITFPSLVNSISFNLQSFRFFNSDKMFLISSTENLFLIVTFGIFSHSNPDHLHATLGPSQFSISSKKSLMLFSDLGST